MADITFHTPSPLIQPQPTVSHLTRSPAITDARAQVRSALSQGNVTTALENLKRCTHPLYYLTYHNMANLMVNLDKSEVLIMLIIMLM